MKVYNGAVHVAIKYLFSSNMVACIVYFIDLYSQRSPLNDPVGQKGRANIYMIYLDGIYMTRLYIAGKSSLVIPSLQTICCFKHQGPSINQSDLKSYIL